MKHPVCTKCNWRKGGVDSWDGNACKCGHYEPPVKCVEAEILKLPPMETKMIERMKAEKWVACDGSEHSSEAAAQSYERYLNVKGRAARVVDVLESAVRRNHFYTLTKDDALFPYNQNHGDSYDQNSFLDELGQLIVDHWEDLKRALDGEVK